MARNVPGGGISGRRIQLSTNNCKGTFHKVTTDMFIKRLASLFQGAWFPLKTCSVLLLNIFYFILINIKPVHRLTFGQSPENDRPCSGLLSAPVRKLPKVAPAATRRAPVKSPVSQCSYYRTTTRSF